MEKQQKEEIIEKLIEQLQKRERNEKINDKNIIAALGNLAYFKKFASSPNFVFQIQQCGAAIKYEYFPKGRFVFHTGEMGQKFYFVLKGKAAVFVPKAQTSIKIEQEWMAHLEMHVENLKRSEISQFQRKQSIREVARTKQILAETDVSEKDRALLASDDRFLKKYFSFDQ